MARPKSIANMKVPVSITNRDWDILMAAVFEYADVLSGKEMEENQSLRDAIEHASNRFHAARRRTLRRSRFQFRREK